MLWKGRWWIVFLVAFPLITLGLLFLFGRTSVDQMHIAHIKRLGGLVVQEDVVPAIVATNSPQFLRRFFSKGKVKSIAFFGPRPTDTDLLPFLTHFQELKQIGLSNTRVTDEIIGAISTQKILQMLWLSGTGISDAGIASLSSNEKVTHIFLDSTQITDESLIYLSKMPQIFTLSCANTKITDATVDLILKMPNLRFLDVSGTQISENGIQKLKQKEGLVLTPGLSGL